MSSPIASKQLVAISNREMLPVNGIARDNSEPSINVLGVRVNILTMDHALSRIAEILLGEEKAYLSTIGVHGVMEAQRDPDLARAYADATITIPDGMPIAWVGRIRGHRNMQRVLSGLRYAAVGGGFLASMVWTVFLVYEAGRLLLLTVY